MSDDKITIRFTVGIKSDEAPQFMDDEKPGVFATQEITIKAEDADNPRLTMFLLEREKELLEEVVEVTIEVQTP